MSKEVVTCAQCGYDYMAEECQKCNPGFKKYDQDKLRLDLLPPEWVEGLVQILMYGANKYDDDNWRKCDSAKHYTNAAGRHLLTLDHCRGPFLDEESGLPHLLHAAVSCLMAYSVRIQEVCDDAKTETCTLEKCWCKENA